MKLVFAALGSVVFAQASLGAFDPAYERVLIPVVITSPVSGAFGSQWVTSLTVTNRSTSPVQVTGYANGGCRTGACEGSGPVPPNTTLFPVIALPEGVNWALLGVDRTKTLDVAFGLRVQDTSRALHTWGSGIPVVRERDALRGTFTISDIPVSHAIRTTLRVYQFDPSVPASVTIRISATEARSVTPTTSVPDAPIVEFRRAFRTVASLGDLNAGYIEIPLTTVLPPSAAQHLRIDIVPDDDRANYWGFASVTNNETQHVTVLSPQ
jgi:hypothetical protein